MYSRMDQVKFFKGYLPQILLSPFLNILSHINPLEVIKLFSLSFHDSNKLSLIDKFITLEEEALSFLWSIL